MDEQENRTDMVLSRGFAIPRLSRLPVGRTHQPETAAIAHPGLSERISRFGGLSEPELRCGQIGSSVDSCSQQTTQCHFASNISLGCGFFQLSNVVVLVNWRRLPFLVKIGNRDSRRRTAQLECFGEEANSLLRRMRKMTPA